MPISPDVPAYINYLVVIASGVFVAVTTVNTLLQDQRDRWAFSRTWILALAHVAIPPLLFWFLDYTEVVHDTSLFVALVVGFGYRQVFAGGVQGITLGGQTPALWKPFEAWVQRVIVGISNKNKEYRDRFDDTSKRVIATSPVLLQGLEALAPIHSSNAVTLSANVNAARALFAGGHLDSTLTDLLWDDLRQSKPKRYAYILRDERLVPRLKVWWWFDKGRSKTVISSVLLMCVVVVVWVALLGAIKSEPLLLRYYQWRVIKPHVTERDRFRALEYMDWQLSRIDADSNDQRGRLEDALGLLIAELKFVDMSEPIAERIVALVVRNASAIKDDGVVRSLIGALWTESGAIRARINRGLVQIQKKAYPDLPLPDGLTTAPESGEAFEAVDHRVRKWLEWWDSRLKPKPEPPPSPPIVEGIKRGRFVIEVPFAFNSDEVPSELEKPLEELASLLKENSGWRLRVESHTDNIGSDSANLALSKRRATSIIQFLTQKKGVPAERLAARAAGEREPRGTNDTPEGRQKNRRVEMVRTDGEFSQ